MDLIFIICEKFWVGVMTSVYSCILPILWYLIHVYALYHCYLVKYAIIFWWCQCLYIPMKSYVLNSYWNKEEVTVKNEGEWNTYNGAMSMTFQTYPYYIWLWYYSLLYVLTLEYLFPEHNTKHINLGYSATCIYIIWLFIYSLKI